MIAPSNMNNRSLRGLIRSSASEIIQDQLGFWKFKFADRLVFVITDANHNRMRIMSPITELDGLQDQELQILLAANFDRALDARYCMNDDLIWSAFLHPLEELSEGQFLDALNQVVTLAKNFGTTYTSSDLIFGG